MKKSKSKKKFLLIIIVGILMVIHFVGNPIDNLKLLNYNSNSIYVYNLTDDKEVISLNANKKRNPASLVKIMTTYVALQHIDDLSKIAPIDYETYTELVNNNASMAGFVAGENTSYRDLLYGTILPSGAEAANSLAINVSSNIESFIEKMNQEVVRLKLNNTKYKSVDGLDKNGQFTSAKDVAMLIKKALEDGNFRAIFTKSEYLSTGTNVHPNGVYMESTVLKKLKNYNQDGFKIIGGKSGTTDKAGLCWATLANKNNKEYIIVVMGAKFTDYNNTGDGQIEDTLKVLREINSHKVDFSFRGILHLIFKQL